MSKIYQFTLKNKNINILWKIILKIYLQKSLIIIKLIPIKKTIHIPAFSNSAACSAASCGSIKCSSLQAVAIETNKHSNGPDVSFWILSIKSSSYFVWYAALIALEKNKLKT